MRNPTRSKPAEACLGVLFLAASSLSLTMPKPASMSTNHHLSQRVGRGFSELRATAQDEQEFDKLLQDTKLSQAVNFLRSHPDLDLTRDRFNRIFDTIEEVTAEAEASSINTRQEQEQDFPLLSKSRLEMTDMYTTLKDEDHLRLFGAISKENMPASGSYTVRPSMLEEISLLSMKALTPKPSNTLLYAGVGVAVLEAIASAALGIDLNILFLFTLVSALADRLLLNGALSETFVKILSPETQPKITRHEAGHFLLAYLLGCPVEGYVLSAWAALQDARFGSRAVSAGTSFFDSDLSSQIAASKVTRSSIDRYSIIVMAGISAEAVNYGRADGGAGDEMALIAFLSNLNGKPSSNPAWNDVTIRNQARWGALQAVLLLREYKECYDALVDALERGGSLGDCIYAIENAGREHNKLPLKEPLGYILDRPGGLEESWVTELPKSSNKEETVVVAAQKAPLDPEKSLETLREYKEMMKAKLKDIDGQLEQL
jgi:hypothetical protein